jgi:hypothetical protein
VEAEQADPGVADCQPARRAPAATRRRRPPSGLPRRPAATTDRQAATAAPPGGGRRDPAGAGRGPAASAAQASPSWLRLSPRRGARAGGRRKDGAALLQKILGEAIAARS